MDSKTVKLNCLTLGELENEPISQKSGLIVSFYLIFVYYYNYYYITWLGLYLYIYCYIYLFPLSIHVSLYLINPLYASIINMLQYILQIL